MESRLVDNQDRKFPTESAKACDTSLVAGGLVVEKLDKITLQNIAEERVDIIAEEMQLLPDEYLEELKNSLRVILKGNGDSLEKKEFMALQKLVHARSDLTAETLLQAHRAQLEILVAMKMGTQTLLDPIVSRSALVEIFTYKRCKIIACQRQLPAHDCTCVVCTNKNGFCSSCMCVICTNWEPASARVRLLHPDLPTPREGWTHFGSCCCCCFCVICTKFDDEVNFHWLDCDVCSHRSHTECAIRDGLISMDTCTRRFRRDQTGEAEMVFRCRGCNSTCELLGWVKSVFQQSAFSWNPEALMTQLDILGRIFRGSDDVKGRKLFWKCEELIKKLKGGLPESTACREFLMCFREDSHEHLTSKKKGLEEEEPIMLYQLKEAARLVEAKQDNSKKRTRDAIAVARKDPNLIVEWKEGDDASNGGKRPNKRSKNPASSVDKEATPQDISSAFSVQPITGLPATSLAEVPTSFLNGGRRDRALMLQTILHQVTPPADRERIKAESFDDKLDNATFTLVEGCLRTLATLEFTAQERATLESKVKELQKHFVVEQTRRKKLEDELGKKKREVSQLKQELIECRERFERFSKEEERLRVARARDLEAMKTTLGSYLERELSYLGSRSEFENASRGDTEVNQVDDERDAEVQEREEEEDKEEGSHDKDAYPNDLQDDTVSPDT